LTLTGFADDNCLHPVWESGLNVGICVQAMESNGTVVGSYRTSAMESKGKMTISTNSWSNGWCNGMVESTWDSEKVADNQCGPAKGVDGASRIHSGLYRFNPYGFTPLIVKFLTNLRATIEYDGWSNCPTNWHENSLTWALKYTIQKTAPFQTCYQWTDTMTGKVTSYMTTCHNRKLI
jgi:hypothetical protein